MATGEAVWRVRSEDGLGEGRAVDFVRLTQAISDGVLGEADQVRGPNDARWRLIAEHPQLEEYLPPRPLFAPRAGDDAEMDMTPMIDVTFQLLIFFMITACFVVQKTLDMPASQPDQQNARKVYSRTELKKNNIYVVVKHDNSITVDDKPVGVAELTDALKAAAKNRDNLEMVLDADSEVENETVVRVIDGAAGAQIEKILFVSHVAGSGGTGSGNKVGSPEVGKKADLPDAGKKAVSPNAGKKADGRNPGKKAGAEPGKSSM